MNKPYIRSHFAGNSPAVEAVLPRAAGIPLADAALVPQQSQNKPVSPALFRGALRTVEFLALFVAGLASAVVNVDAADLTVSPSYLMALAGTAIVAVVLFDMLGLYRTQAIASLLHAAPRALCGWTAAAGLLTATVFFLKVGPEFSRLWLATWYVSAAGAILLVRIAAASLARRWALEGRLNRQAIIVGGGDGCFDLISRLEHDASTDLRIIGFFDDRSGERSPSEIAGYPKLGTIDDLTAFARHNHIDVVLVCLPMSAEKRLLAIAKVLKVLPIDVRLSTAGSRLRFRPRTYDYIGSTPFIALADKPIGDWGLLAKAALDKTVAALALIGLAPLLAGVAVAIRCESRGPILFRQKRYGFNNELIEVLKFRSMYVDKCDAEATRLVTKDDPRVTPIGRFIRRTSIDELPQLINVLRGELSLVGPRPHALQAKAANQLYDQAVEGYFARHRVKPGITGWAQIHGWRGETDTTEKIQKRVEHDLHYIENWSLARDIYILFRTPIALLKSDGAY